MKLGTTMLWAGLATIAGTGLFLLKYQVQAEEQRLRHLQKEIVQTQEEIHVLKAEWSVLNDPARLRDLAERNLGMHPVKPAQIAALTSVPMADRRPDDVPAAGNQLASIQQQASPVSVPSVTPTIPGQAVRPAATSRPGQAPGQALATQPQQAMPVIPAQPPVRSFDVKASAKPATDQAKTQAAKAVQAAPLAAPSKTATVKTALVPAKPVAAPAKTMPVAVPAPPQAKPVLKTAKADVKPAAKPVAVAQAAAPTKPAAAAKSSYPSVYPTYTAYPATSSYAAPVTAMASARPAPSASSNVMVITSPALSGQ